MPRTPEQMKEYQARRRALLRAHPDHRTPVDGCPECRAQQTTPEPPVQPAARRAEPAPTPFMDPLVTSSTHWTPDARPEEARFWMEPPVRPASGPWSLGAPFHGRPVARTPYVPTTNDLMRDQAIAEKRRRA